MASITTPIMEEEQKYYFHTTAVNIMSIFTAPIKPTFVGREPASDGSLTVPVFKTLVLVGLREWIAPLAQMDTGLTEDHAIGSCWRMSMEKGKAERLAFCLHVQNQDP